MSKLLVAVLLALTFSFAGGTGKVDIDLTRMSGTMVYAQVFQMVTEPEKYVGKRIKMKGVFSSYYDNEVKQRFYGCVISDALACCSQGLAFELSKPRKYSEGYPEEGDGIVIVGEFTYVKEEDGADYPLIRHAEMQTEK